MFRAFGKPEGIARIAGIVDEFLHHSREMGRGHEISRETRIVMAGESLEPRWRDMKVSALGITRDAPWPPPGAGKGPCDARSSGASAPSAPDIRRRGPLQASWQASAPMRGARGMSRMTTMDAGAMDGWVLMG